MESYKIQKAKMTKRDGRVSFDFVTEYFRLSVRGTWKKNSFKATVSPVNIEFMGETVLEIDAREIRPVFRTKSYAVPLSMMNKFFKMLRAWHKSEEGHNMTQNSVDEFVAGLRKDKPRGSESKCPCKDPENHNEPWCVRCELKMKH